MASLKPQSIDHALRTASEHLNAGRFGEASAICANIVERLPGNADALHILGLGQLQQGHPETALMTLERATSARKSDGRIANSLALARLALGQVDNAAAGLKKLATKGKLTAEGITTLGNCRLRQGQPEKARTCFEHALKLHPNFPAALVNLGEALKEEGRLNDAISHYREVTQKFPTLPSAWRNLGLVLQSAERFSESIPALQNYRTAAPTDIAGIKSLGHSYHQSSQFELALKAFDDALEIDPKDAETWNNRGLSLRALERIDEAKDAFSKALSFNQDLFPALNNLAHLIHDVEGIDAALPLLKESVDHSIDAPNTHKNRGQAHLMEGRITDGWDDYRWRFKQPPEYAGLRNHPFPTWSGGDISDRTLLVWGEQGVGDEILHAGLLHEVIKLAKHVVIETDPRLVPLFRRSFPSATVAPRSNPPDLQISSISIDVQISMGDLVPILRPDLGSFPGPSSYLRCDEDRRTVLRRKYSGDKPKRVVIGIAWHSGRAENGWLKSIPLKQFKPLLLNMETTFVSLQYGDHSSEIREVESELGRKIIQDSSIDPLQELDGFTAQVAALDLVITTSNTTAHVAGALGVPVWTLVPRLGSGALLWYWFRSGSTSPWYDSMTLFRQTKWHDWTDVIEQVDSNLQTFRIP